MVKPDDRRPRPGAVPRFLTQAACSGVDGFEDSGLVAGGWPGRIPAVTIRLC